MATTLPGPSATGSSLQRQPKYYEADGALRAYATKSLIVAGGAVFTSVIAVAGVFYVRIQPPTIIKESASGDSQVIGPRGTLTGSTPAAIRQVEASQAPSDLDKEVYVRTFIDNYLNYDEHTLAPNWSRAFNMMTLNLKDAYMASLQRSNLVGQYEDEHVRSDMHIKSLTRNPNDPLTYEVFCVRNVHRLASQTESASELVESYKVRLAETSRSEKNPSGLVIADISSTQISSSDKTPTVIAQN